ncbi:MAG: DoxX family protein [Myxococcota bacterium]|nr:DoxX family protein [Myxococcota bacterium]
MTNASTMNTNRFAWLENARDRALDFTARAQGVAPLLGRLAVGLVFMSTGWGKVHNLEKVTGFFQGLGIPAPAFNAVLVGYSELLCGTALVLGLFTRLATLPLMVSMIVAILTAKRSELHGLFDLVGFEEFTYLCVLAMIAVLGPGALAVDRFLPWLEGTRARRAT